MKRYGNYGLSLGGAALFPMGRNDLPIGETSAAHMRLYGLAALDNELRIGARFMLTEGGRPVIRGAITALLPDVPDLPSSR